MSSDRNGVVTALTVAVALLLIMGAASAASVSGPRHRHRHPTSPVASPPASTTTPSTTIPTSGPGLVGTFTSVSFATAEVGFAASAEGLAESSDGGRTWHLVAPHATTAPFIDVSQVSFSDATHGVAEASPIRRGPSRLYATADGGRTWRLVPGILGVQRIVTTGPTVWVVSGVQQDISPADLWVSPDQGATWAQKFALPSNDATEFSAVSSTTPMT